jgi:hypothetical protein
MSYYTFAHSVKVDDDEGRFTLEVETDEQIHRFIIHDIDLDAFYDQVKARIGPYLRERDDARSFVCAPADVDESGGYDVSDPKHPNYHSLNVDLWDQRDGK